MAAQKTNRGVEEVTSADSEIESENPNIREVPSELWAIIFDELKKAYTKENCANINKAMAQPRKVCRKWRNVIDAHSEFHVKLTSQFVNTKYLMKHVRIEKCSVSNLAIMPIQPSEIPFPNPHLTKEVFFGEFVSKKNFLMFAKHFCKIDSVKISQGYWYNGCIETTPDEDAILERFWGGIEKLDLNIPFMDLMVIGWERERNLIKILTSVILPKLTNFKISAHWRLMVTQLVFIFLSRHPKVKNVQVQLAPFDDTFDRKRFLSEAEMDKDVYRNPSLQVSLQDLEKIQLETIIIGGAYVSKVVRETWMPIIMAQKGLVHLSISNICEASKVNHVENNLLSFDDFIPLLEVNINTLTSLELVMFHFSETVDFQMFRKLSSLQILKLRKQYDGNLSRIANMTRLPASLKTLSISGLACMNIQLKHLVQCKRLKNFSNLQLSSILYYNSNHPRSIVEEFLLKNYLRRACSFSTWIH